MHITRKIEQSRRDFTAVYTCGHCGHEEEGPGYDDDYFHTIVVPGRICPKCDRAGGGVSTRPDVPAHVVI